MRYYRCKCGKLESYGSMGPHRCSWCVKCKTTLATHPDFHKTVRPKHKMSTEEIMTDEGVMHITRCIWCGRRKDTLEKAKEPIEFE